MIFSSRLKVGTALCLLITSVASAKPGPATQPVPATQSDDSPEAVTAHVLELVRAQHSANGFEGINARQTLDMMGPEAAPAVDGLIKLLDDPKYQGYAAEELGRIGEGAHNAVTPLIHQAKSADGNWNSWVIDALGGIGTDANRCVPLFIEALQKGDHSTQEAAARALVEFGNASKPALPALIQALHSDDERVRDQSCEAIAGQGHDAVQALPVLKEMVKGLNEHSRETQSIADALAAMGKPGLPTLLEMLNSKDENIRGPVYKDLAKLQGDAAPAVPRLIELLKQSDERRFVIRALRCIGTNAMTAVPALMAIAKDSKDDAHESAAHALVAIDPVAAQKAGIKDPDTVYMACINQDPRYYRSRELGMISFGEPMNCVVVWINGDPVDFYTGGGTIMTSLNRYLKPGKNELTFSQPHKMPVFVGVFRAIAGDVEPIGIEAFRGPASAQLAPPLQFDVDRLSPMTARESLQGLSHDTIQREVHQQLGELITLMNAHDGKKAADLLFAGERALSSGDDRTDIDGRADEIVKALSNPGIAAILSEHPIQLLFGKTVVRAYIQLPVSQKEPAPIIRIKQGGKTGGFASILFIAVHGKLVIWEIPGGLGLSISSGK